MKMMKRTLCLVLALVMLVGMFTVGVSADDLDKSVTIKFFVKYPDDYYKYGSSEQITTATASSGRTLASSASWLLNEGGYTNTINSQLSGYTLTGVFGDENGGSLDSVVMEPNGTYSVYCDAAGVSNYTLTLNSGVGSSTKTVTGTYGDLVTLPANTFTNGNKVFKGWALTEMGNVFYGDGDQIVLTNDNLYAVWEDAAVTPPASTTAPSAGYEVSKAVTVKCSVCKVEKSFSFKVPYSNATVTNNTVTYPVDTAAYVTEFDKYTVCDHTHNSRELVSVTLSWNGGAWVVADTNDAVINASCAYDHGYWCSYCDTYHLNSNYHTGYYWCTYCKEFHKNGHHTGYSWCSYCKEWHKDNAHHGYWCSECKEWHCKKTYHNCWCDICDGWYCKHYEKKPVASLTKSHVAYLKGYGGGYVKPEGTMTKAEAATILYRLLDSKSAKAYFTSYNAFQDVNKGDWFNDAISTLVNAGVIDCKGGNYNPNEAITRAELVVMLTRLTDSKCTSKVYFKDVPETYWAFKEIALAQYLGWVKGYQGCFDPDDTVTRAEVAAMLNRVLDRDDCKTKDTKNYVDNPVNAWYYQDIVEASIAH